MRFLITTNATLLDETIVEYMVQHNFDITISFDGPREIRDKYRRFASGNKGTFDIVMKQDILNVEIQIVFCKTFYVM